MAAYSLEDRFPGTPRYFPFLDPGTYQFEKSKLKSNKVPFLSNQPRKTGEKAIIWTHAIYNVPPPRGIPNITAFKSKKSRFPYESFSEEDLKELLCKCGFQNSCLCPEENESIELEVCQGKLKRRLFKGLTPRNTLADEGLSAPSRNDHGFMVDNHGVQKRLREKITDTTPPFYDSRVNEFTTFYQGCKWSRRTSTRSHEVLEIKPGPADYQFQRRPTEDVICAEKLRASKRKLSKQPRFIEIIQRRDILEGRPGPGSYTPLLPKGTDLKFVGSTATRFPTEHVECPGPAEYYLRRNFDPIDAPSIPCHATLPEPAFFGIKAQRFKAQIEEGPSPATYTVNYPTCRFVRCTSAPFGSSDVRFKSEDNDQSDGDDISENNIKETTFTCPSPTSVFKSKTKRMKPLTKKNYEPSPADMMPMSKVYRRNARMQYAAPFYSSAGRFQPWYNWIPVHGKLKTPTSCAYNTAKPTSDSAFKHGPMFRAKRFRVSAITAPAPNQYKVAGGIENILKTHNKRLTDNIEHQHKFSWYPPAENHTHMSYDQKEALLFEKCIQLLDTHEDIEELKCTSNRYSAPIFNKIENKNATQIDILSLQKGHKLKVDNVGTESKIKKNESKLLRTFLYAHEMPNYF